jgi:hypothetical protein
MTSQWKAGIAGLEMLDAKRLQVLVDENSKLKLLQADTILDYVG